MYPVTVRGKTIELREFDPSDAAALAAVIGEEAVLRYTTWKGPNDLEAAEGFIHTVQEMALADPRVEYILAIVSLANGEVIGTGGIRHDDEAGEVGSLRCMLRPDAWGQGVATEAAAIALEFGFETLGLSRIEADPALANPAAHRVLEKVGLSQVEVRPEHHLSPSGELQNSVGYAITRAQWSAARPADDE